MREFFDMRLVDIDNFMLGVYYINRINTQNYAYPHLKQKKKNNSDYATCCSF